MEGAAAGPKVGAVGKTKGLDWAKLLRRGLVVAVVVPCLYFGVTFFQVWWTSRHDGARKAQAVVALGAAQYDGRPSSAPSPTRTSPIKGLSEFRHMITETAQVGVGRVIGFRRLVRAEHRFAFAQHQG